MPLRLNLGLSRKIGEANYGSRGATVNVEMEVDSGLVLDPPRLQEKIRQLFGLVRSSLAEELNGQHHDGGQGPRAAGPLASGPNGNGQNGAGQNGHGHNGNGHPGNGQQLNGQQGNGARARPATQSQVKALYAIARSRGLSLEALLQDRFQVHKPDHLTLTQASGLIDTLKKE